MDLALYNLQRLICYKKNQNNQQPIKLAVNQTDALALNRVLLSKVWRLRRENFILLSTLYN